MKVSRYGHLRSAPVVVDGGIRTEWEPPTLRAALWLSTRPTWAPPRGLTASPTSRERVCRVVAVQDTAMRSLLLQALQPDPEVRERCRVRRLPFVYSPSGCAGQCALLFHSYCDSRGFIVFSRPRGLWASMCCPDSRSDRAFFCSTQSWGRKLAVGATVFVWDCHSADRTCYALRDTLHSHLLRVCFA